MATVDRRRPASGLARGAVPLALTAALALAGAAAPPAHSASGDSPYYTVVSHPDFLNSDVGDLTRSPYWDPEAHAGYEGINASWEAGLDTVIGEMEAHDPSSILVAGDLVDGHWGLDGEGTGILGPVDTVEQKGEAIKTAADLYYPQWLDRFEKRGLTVHAAVGDHELGDNPWRDSAAADFKRSEAETFRASWAKYFTRGHDGEPRYGDRPTGQHAATAYAELLHPEVLLVTLDTFKVTETDVVATVDGPQLSWLDGVLTRANDDGIDWIIVQGHTPVLTPVRARHSSRLTLKGGGRSELWRTLVRHRVDLYLSGEVHDTTATHLDGVTQIAHGGMFHWAESSFLVARFHDDRVELQIHDPVGEVAPSEPTLWSTALARRPRAEVRYTGGTTVRGTMKLTPDNTVVRRTGNLGVFRPRITLLGRANQRTLTNQGTWVATGEPGSRYKFETRTAAGSGTFGPRRATAWRVGSTLRRKVAAGRTVCARVRALGPQSGLTSAWTRWRCVSAPYDDRALRAPEDRVRQGEARRYYQGTWSRVLGRDTVVAGPRVHASVDVVRLGLLVGPRAGRVEVQVGGTRVARLQLRRPRSRVAWLSVRAGDHSGRLTIRKLGTRRVTIDGVELPHLQ
jgi:hypothetical protein